MRRASAVVTVVLALAMSVTISGCNSAAARVNGETISRQQWEDRYETLKAQGDFDFEGSAGQATMIELKQRALDELIDEVLVRQEAERRSIKVSDGEIDRLIRDTVNEFESEEEFYAQLADQGLSEEVLADYLSNRLLKQRLKESLGTTSTVSDAEVESYYVLHQKDFFQKEQLIVAHILFNKDEFGTADRVLTQILDGADFAEMAKKYSRDEASKNNEGVISAQMPLTPEVHGAAGVEKPGQVHDRLVEDGTGVHIVKLIDRIPAHQMTLEEATQPIRVRLAMSDQEDSYYNLIQQLRRDAEIEVLLDELKVPGGGPAE